MWTCFFTLILWSQGLLLCVLAGKALEKAGGKEFLETVKELRKSQGPLEVAEGEKDSLLSFGHGSFYMSFSLDILICSCCYVSLLMWCKCFLKAVADIGSLLRGKKRKNRIPVGWAHSVLRLINLSLSISVHGSPKVKEILCHLSWPVCTAALVRIRNSSQLTYRLRKN